MVFHVQASTAKLRQWLQTALTGFDTLDKETAIAQAKLKLRCALEYLDSVDRAGDILKSGVPLGRSGGTVSREVHASEHEMSK